MARICRSRICAGSISFSPFLSRYFALARALFLSFLRSRVFSLPRFSFVTLAIAPILFCCNTGYKVKDIAAALHLTSGQPQHGPHRRGDPAATPTQQGHESSLLSTDEKGGAKGGSVKGSGDKGLGNVGVKRNANGSVSSDEKTAQQTSPEQEKALSSDDELDPDSQRLDAGARARVMARKEEGVVSRSSQTQGSRSSISGDAEEKGGGEVTGGEGEGGGADEL